MFIGDGRMCELSSENCHGRGKIKSSPYLTMLFIQNNSPSDEGLLMPDLKVTLKVTIALQSLPDIGSDDLSDHFGRLVFMFLCKPTG